MLLWSKCRSIKRGLVPLWRQMDVSTRICLCGAANVNPVLRLVDDLTESVWVWGWGSSQGFEKKKRNSRVPRPVDSRVGSNADEESNAGDLKWQLIHLASCRGSVEQGTSLLGMTLYRAGCFNCRGEWLLWASLVEPAHVA